MCFGCYGWDSLGELENVMNKLVFNLSPSNLNLVATCPNVAINSVS